MDTATKRASALGVALPFVLLVLPSGTIEQTDRQTIAHCYSGIQAAEPTVEAPTIGAQLSDTYQHNQALSGLLIVEKIQLSGHYRHIQALSGTLSP